MRSKKTLFMRGSSIVEKNGCSGVPAHKRKADSFIGVTVRSWLGVAYLHSVRDDITDERSQLVLEAFRFVVPPEGSTDHCNQTN